MTNMTARPVHNVISWFMISYVSLLDVTVPEAKDILISRQLYAKIL
jgi:hypothetical protein